MTMMHELRAPDGKMIAWLQERPSYCDRGRYHAGFEITFPISSADSLVRYYFVLDTAKVEVEMYLRAKKIDITGATWVEKKHNPGESVTPPSEEGQADPAPRLAKCHHPRDRWYAERAYEGEPEPPIQCGVCFDVIPTEMIDAARKTASTSALEQEAL
jgi:hypothetical protein